jgi:hypothetical protein
VAYLLFALMVLSDRNRQPDNKDDPGHPDNRETASMSVVLQPVGWADARSDRKGAL